MMRYEALDWHYSKYRQKQLHVPMFYDNIRDTPKLLRHLHCPFSDLYASISILIDRCVDGLFI